MTAILFRSGAFSALIASVVACTNPGPAETPAVPLETPLALTDDLEQGEFRSGSWFGLSETDQTGALKRCAITTRYGSGRRLYFSLDRNGAFGFYVSGSGWTLTRGERHPIAYGIDEYAYAETARAIYDDILQVELNDPPLMFERFRAASVVSVEVLGGRFRFAVPGIAAALDVLRGCVISRGGASTVRSAPPAAGINPFLPPRSARGGESGQSQPGAAGSNPFAPRAPVGRSDPNAPAAHVAARRFVERLLTQAGLTDYHILTGGAVPAGSRHADVAWRVGGEVGTLLIVEARRYPSVVEASASIVKDASLICDEGFTSSIAARRLRDGRPAAQMVVSCTRPTAFHAAYTVVPVTGIGYYRINLSATGEAGEIDAMHGRIGEALTRVVPEE